MVYLIAYDLNKPGQQYQELYAEIKDLGDWLHCMESVWLVDAYLKEHQIRKRLEACLDANDKLLVAKICKGLEMQLPEEDQEWIADHMGSNPY